MSRDLIVRSLSQWEEAIGADVLNNLISTFSCPLNLEVESFLKNKAVQSAHLSASQSYLVCDLKTKNLLGYYTLVLKSYTVNGATLNSKNRRLIARFADSDSNGNFNVAVYLIAQIGKNYALPKLEQIAGDALIDLALDEFRQIKGRVGGKLVMVERESDRPKLLGFYNRNGFKLYQKAADRGFVGAMMALGQYYSEKTGFLGGRRDKDLAVKYYTMAADRGSVEAQGKLKEL